MLQNRLATPERMPQIASAIWMPLTLPRCGMGGGFRFIAQRQEIFSIVPLAKLDARGNQTTAQIVGAGWIWRAE